MPGGCPDIDCAHKCSSDPHSAAPVAVLPLVAVLNTTAGHSAEQLAAIVHMQQQCVRDALERLRITVNAPPPPPAGTQQVHLFPSALAVLNHPQLGPFELVGYVVDAAAQTTNPLFWHCNQLVVFT